VAIPAVLEIGAWPLAAAALGLAIGSFANVCIHRLPYRQSIVHPPSRCPGCGSLIAPWDNVPVLSYLVLLGRCRHCRALISPRYPLVEAANGALYFGIAHVFGMAPRAFVLMAFVTALLILSLIDLEHQILPDAITLPGIVAGVLCSLVAPPPTPLQSAAAALGGYVAFMLIARTWKRLRRIDALGQGDWKLAAMLGAFLGGPKLLFTVFVAALLGTVVGVALIAFKGRTFQHKLPFGTFLGAAGIVAVFVGDDAVRWYRSFLEV
jgi:leader peptidase (prepilin peptidase)/N-methyltransferase